MVLLMSNLRKFPFRATLEICGCGASFVTAGVEFCLPVAGSNLTGAKFGKLLAPLALQASHLGQ